MKSKPAKLVFPVLLALVVTPILLFTVVFLVAFGTVLSASVLNMDTDKVVINEFATATLLFVGYFIFVPLTEEKTRDKERKEQWALTKDFYIMCLALFFTGLMVPWLIAFYGSNGNYLLFSAGATAPLFGMILANSLFFNTEAAVNYLKRYFGNKTVA